MEVIKISETVQKFDGLSYYKCGFYFQRKGVRLHRKVWEYHNGEIPQGYDIHHIDGDRSNNDISNLQLMEGGEHGRHHMLQPERIEMSKKAIELARVGAIAWHKSEAGREWHRQHFYDVWEQKKANPVYYTYTCAYCGKEFQSTHKRGGNRFCSSNHKTYFVMGRKYENSREAKSKQG